jgi:pyruvate/2-oxoglutarate dehydrogenase complex dihydrolipoamide dehydrogenase (E3) component
VICAIGALPIVPSIRGVDGENVIWAADSIRQPEKTGKKIVIIGGGQVGCETAIHFGMAGKDVTLMEMLPSLAPDAMRTYREELQGQVSDHCTAVLPGARCSGISADGVTYTDKDGIENTITADTVIIAVGMRPKDAEAEMFRACAADFRRVGDCAVVGNVKHAIRGAFDAAMTL